MALDQEGFTLATDKTIEELRNGEKNTSKSTLFLLSVWKAWCEGETITLVIKEQELAELNSLLEKF